MAARGFSAEQFLVIIEHCPAHVFSPRGASTKFKARMREASQPGQQASGWSRANSSIATSESNVFLDHDHHAGEDIAAGKGKQPFGIIIAVVGAG